MIHIWQWDIPLSAGLQFLAGPIGSALGTLLFWLLVSMVVRFVVLRIIQALARRTETDVGEAMELNARLIKPAHRRASLPRAQRNR